jgi:hypothetical protein
MLRIQDESVLGASRDPGRFARTFFAGLSYIRLPSQPL